MRYVAAGPDGSSAPDAAAGAPAEHVAQSDLSFRTTSPEEATDLCGNSFYPSRLTLLGSSSGFDYFGKIGRIGPFTVGDITYRSDVRLDFDVFEQARTDYNVTVPLVGRLESRHRGRELAATTASASVYRPDGDVTVTRWYGGSRHLVVKIDQDAVDAAVERLIGRPLDAPIAFAPTLPMNDHARAWVRLVATVQRISSPNGLLQTPLVSAPLVDGLIHGLLLSTDHPYREALAGPARPGQPAVVRRAIEIIEAGPDLPLTTSTLAAQCHVSVRTLQDGFKRHVGVSPMMYVRQVRLRRAHQDLRSADPVRHTVASIAHRWGFAHLGRFAAAYKAAYGESPVQALHAVS